MSKSSSKQKVIQLREWLKTIKPEKTSNESSKSKFSKSDHYKKTRERYGSKKSN